jgi:hypothetical protein
MRTVRLTLTPDDRGSAAVTWSARDADGAAWAPVAELTVATADLLVLTPELDAGITEADLTAVGAALFDLVAAGHEAVIWPDGAPARLLIEAGGDLAAVPWELLRRSGHRWLFSAPDSPATRVHGTLRAGLPTIEAPVEVLVIVGDTGDEVGARQEVEAIYETVSDLPACCTVEVLWTPRMGTVRDVIRRSPPHILHCIGHGTLDNAARQPALTVNGGDGPWELTGAFVAGALAGTGATLRLVVLNACRTAGTGAAAVQGVGAAFLDGGASAVVTMQGDVAVPASVAFTREMYAALAKGDPVDVAMTTARFRTQWDRPAFQDRDWALPVLTVTAEPAEVLRTVRVRDPRETLRDAADQDMIRGIVDRSDARREIWRWLTTWRDTDCDLLLISGESRVGKSALARWAVLAGRIHGIPAAHLELAPTDGNLEWQSFLRRLAETIASAVGPAADGPATAFFAALDRLRAGRAPVAAPAVLSLADVFGGAVRPRTPADRVDEAFAQFSAFVQAAIPGPDGPFVVVVDQFRMVLDRRLVVTRLIARAAEGNLRPLRFVLVDATFDDDLPARLGVHVSIPAFYRDEVVSLADEYCVRIKGQRQYCDPPPTHLQWRRLVDGIRNWAKWRATGEEVLLAEEFPMIEQTLRNGSGIRP